MCVYVTGNGRVVRKVIGYASATFPAAMVTTETIVPCLENDAHKVGAIATTLAQVGAESSHVHACFFPPQHRLDQHD